MIELDHGESENHGPETQESIVRAPGPKNLKMVKISKSLFRDFLIAINHIDHEESEYRGRKIKDICFVKRDG